MGKYTSLRGKVPAFVEETTYQQRVDEQKQYILGSDACDGANVNRLARLFSEYKQKKDDLEEQVADINVGLEALSQLLVEQLEDQSVQKVELASGAVVFLQDTPYPIVRDKDVVLDWIKQQKMQSLLTVHFQTLKAMTSERLVAGKPCIPGTEVYLKTQARVRNGKNEDA